MLLNFINKINEPLQIQPVTFASIFKTCFRKITALMKKTFIALALVATLAAGAWYGCKNMGSSSSSNDLYNTKSKPATEFPNKMAIAWMDLLCDQVRFQRVGPPPAARAMGYLGVAMYQSVVPGIPDGHSLEGQLKDLKNLPKPDNDKEYDWPTVLNNSSYVVCDQGLARYMDPTLPI